MKTTTNVLITILAIAALSTGCASAPNKFAAASDDTPAASFCKAEAVKIAHKVGIRQMGGNALSGHSDPMEIREAVMADCMSQQRVAGR